MTSRSFADQLRRYRERAALTQEQLAEKTGLTTNGIGALERAERVHPYPHTVRLLAAALGLADEESAAFQAAIPRRRSNVTPRLPVVPDNLPEPLNALIGRESDVAETVALLVRAPERLITLTGVGGCGKTRLALQVARELRDRFPDGICLVELATIADPGLVPQKIASALELQEAAGASFLEVLVTFLEKRTLLLMLDNCEHLVGACAVLAEHLLSRCGNLRLLATSREPLRIVGELQRQVSPLDAPPFDRALSLDDLLCFPAVRLFAERARAVATDFRLTPENAPAVGKICSQVNGIPLAIELAAARVRVLTAEQIGERLDDSFRLLADGTRTAPARQQTLEATLDWSYDLLSEVEKTAFRRLAVFPGGWSVEGAEAIWPSASLTPPGVARGGEVLDVLTRLVDKSLVVVEGRTREARYRLLEPVRQYAQRCLAGSGENQETRARHARYYLELATRAETESTGPRQIAWLDRLQQEHDNLRGALHWLHDLGDVDQDGLRLAGTLWRFWWLRSYFSEGRAQFQALLALARPADLMIRAKALRALGELTFRQGKCAEARPLLETALASSEESGDRLGAAAALRGLGRLALDGGEHAIARAAGGEPAPRAAAPAPFRYGLLAHLPWLAGAFSGRSSGGGHLPYGRACDRS